jgi:hypothetical protein
MCFLVFDRLSMKHYLFQEELTKFYNKLCVPFIKYMTCLSNFKGNYFSLQMIEKYSNIKFHENVTKQQS